MYQIRVLQPAGSALAAELAGLLHFLGADLRIGQRRARRHAGHVLVYITIIQKGQDQ